MSTGDDELRNSAAHYAEKYGFSRTALEKGLEAYAVHLFAQEQGLDSVLDGAPTEEAELGDYVLRSDDLGVDGVLTDDAAPRVVLIQATWRANARGIEEKLNSFAGILPRLVDPDYVAQGGEKAQALLGALAQQINDGYSIELRFVTNVKTRENIRLKNAVQAANRAFEKDPDKTVKLTLFGGADLVQRQAELAAASTGQAVEEAEFAIERDKMLVWDDAGGDRKTLLGIIKGNQLAGLYGRYRNELFAANIRLPLITGKVNPEMKSTANDEPHNFFYYNNGISAVCKRLTVNDNRVKAENFQIINGAQTMQAIVGALTGQPQHDLYVMFRVTETAEGYGGPFTDDMIKFNNTQNPVKVSDFVSNDPIQLWLTKELSALSGQGSMPNFYYVHKSGYAPKKTQGLRKLGIDDFARTRHAFLYGPVVSYREPSTFFDRQGRYKEAFGVNGELMSNWDSETLHEAAIAVAINHRVRAIAANRKKNDKTKDMPETRYLYRLSRYVTALVAVALRATKDDTFLEYGPLVHSQPQFDKFVLPLMKIAREHILREMIARSATSVQPEYNFARDDVAWSAMTELMLSSAISDGLPDDL